jgi:tRNA nucleotidyltransferase (CCA-adding enzyme)
MGFFNRISGRRLFSELRLILAEEKPVMALRRMNQFGLLEVIHPQMHLDSKTESLVVSAEKVLTWHKLLFLDDACRRWMVYLLVIEHPFNREMAREFCQRLELNERHQKVLVDQKVKADACLKWLGSHQEMQNSALYRQLDVFHTESLLYMMSVTSREDTRRAISKYFTTLRQTTTFLTGKDLKRLGVEPGPIYRRILNALLDARLDHRVKSREDEWAFVKHQWTVEEASHD